MAITITKDSPSANRISRSLHMLTGYVTMDSSYAAAGESISSIVNEFKDLKRVVFTPRKPSLHADFDDTNSKIRVRRHIEGGDHQHVFRVTDDDNAATTGSHVFGVLSGSDLKLFTGTGYGAEVESAYWRSLDANGHSHSIMITYGAASGSVAANNTIAIRLRPDAYGSGVGLLYDKVGQGAAKLEADQLLFIRTMVSEAHYHWIPIAPKTVQYMHSEGPSQLYINHDGTATDNLLSVTVLDTAMSPKTYDGEVETGANLSGVIFDFLALGSRVRGLSG